MNLGIALSGCSTGGLSAYQMLRLLEQHKLPVTGVSASGIPAIGALCHAVGIAPGQYEALAGEFFSDLYREDLDTAVERLANQIDLKRRKPAYRLTVSAASLPDGKTVAFTNDFSLCAESLTTYPMENSYDMLSATISLCGGLAPYLYREQRLCDYTARHGCPYYALHLAGAERVFSASFRPKSPQTLYEALMESMTEKSRDSADLHVDVLLPSRPSNLSNCNKIAINALSNCIKSSAWKSLF